jgi:hypothetical protein
MKSKGQQLADWVSNELYDRVLTLSLGDRKKILKYLAKRKTSRGGGHWMTAAAAKCLDTMIETAGRFQLVNGVLQKIPRKRRAPRV